MATLLAIQFSTLFPFALFLSVVTLVWVLIDWATKSQPEAERRLEEISGTVGLSKDEGLSEKLAGLLSKASALGKYNMPKKEDEINKLSERLSHAGYRSEEAPMVYLGLKIACLLTGFVFAGGYSAFSHGFNINGLMRFVIIAGGFFYIPELGLKLISNGRKEKIFLGLPDALDLMVVCVEAGLALDQAMRKVAEEMEPSHPIISLEFGQCNMELQMGRKRSEVLHDLGQRTGVDDLRQLASVLIQADKFGSSVAQALRVQSDAMRVRRRQIAEEKAAKTAVQLIFPLVIFIFPAIFVVLVGPAAIQIINQMLPTMGG